VIGSLAILASAAEVAMAATEHQTTHSSAARRAWDGRLSLVVTLVAQGVAQGRSCLQDIELGQHHRR